MNKKKEVPNLGRKELVSRIAQNSDLSYAQVAYVMNTMFDLIVEGLKEGKPVELRKFGVFKMVERKRRIGRNPKKPDQLVEIPAHKEVAFRPGREMRAIWKGKPASDTQT